ncbi:MAG: TIGR03118 family protein [Gaiellaceae bacterium]
MNRRLPHRARSVAAASAIAAVSLGIVFVAQGAGASSEGFRVTPLVSDGGVPAPHHDATLVNAWGLAASPTGPWWTGNEARGTSTLYSSSGQKQLLTVSVPGGPTGVAYYGGSSFLVHGDGRSAPARFVYACEDGNIRAWTPTVPTNWSAAAEVTVDQTGDGAIFRGVAFAHGLLYATDFHNDRVDVFNGAWRRVRLAGSFDDSTIPSWYAPDGIYAAGDHIFVTYVYRAPVDGNDGPTGGFVDEFDLQGKLVARVTHAGLDEPWGLALAPTSFGRLGGDLLVANFGNGEIAAYRSQHGRWTPDGMLDGTNGKPLVLDGVWGIAFGNGGLAGPRDTLFAAAGPHRWYGSSELAVHGLVEAVAQA